MVLLLDNYDSFTYNLRDYILQCGQECTVVRNDEKTLEEIAEMSFDSIVISPGPKTPADAGITMALIAKYHTTMPILGICLGHQALGQFFGAELRRAVRPMHGKTSPIRLEPHYMFRHLPAEVEVMRYHSLILHLPEQTVLQTIAATREHEVMAIAHPELPLVGLQFHPESILTPSGLQMMKNWFEEIG